MNKGLSRGVLLVALGVCAAVAGYGLYHLLGPRPLAGTVTTGEKAPALTLTDLEGVERSLSEWQGKLLLVNFWATWCPPCMKEIPLLADFQSRYGAQGFQVIGPALDDPDAVRAALPRLPINYPVMPGDAPVMQAMDALGDTLGALPFSVLIGRDGTLLYRKHGEFSAAELEALLERHLPPS